MNAQPSFEPPNNSPQRRRRAKSAHQSPTLNVAPTVPSSPPHQRSRVRSNPVYAHRRQGLEALAKLVTYSSLSLFGIVTLVQSIGYNWMQHGKLQYLETELKDTKQRTQKSQNNFMRSFDPESQKSVMEENTYKVAPDRLPVVIVAPTPDRSSPEASRNH